MVHNLFSCGEHSLPNELVLLVIEQLQGDYPTLGSLAVTCKALQHFAEEHLYMKLEIDTVNDLDRIISAFEARPDRVRAVQTLHLQYQYKPRHLNDNMAKRTIFNQFVKSMVNLREWYIESPYDNFHWNEGSGAHEWVEGDMESFRATLEHACVEGPPEAQRVLEEYRLGKQAHRTVGLAQLQHLVIHSHGPHSDFWELGGFHSLFRHPALRYLHVSCVEFPSDIPDLELNPGTTPLTELIFDECIIHPNSLKSILRMPAKLQHLTLGENVFNIRRSRTVAPQLTTKAKSSFEALSVVAHSLVSLTHHDPGWRIDFEPHRPQRMTCEGLGLRNFHALKRIQCETYSFIYRAALMNHEFAPPNLDTLTLPRHWSVSVNFFDNLPELDTFMTLPSLKELELRQSSNMWNEMVSPAYTCDSERLRSRHAFAYKLFERGINLKVSIELHGSDGLIPPYLHGEALPEVRCLYDANEIGFKRKRAVEKDKAGTTNEVGDVLETDQLYEDDITAIKGRMRRAIEQVRARAIRRTNARIASSSTDTSTDISDEDIEDTDMDSESEIEIFEDANGNLYIQMEGDGDDIDEVDETDEDHIDSSEWEDAEEAQEMHAVIDPELD